MLDGVEEGDDLGRALAAQKGQRDSEEDGAENYLQHVGRRHRLDRVGRDDGQDVVDGGRRVGGAPPSD